MPTIAQRTEREKWKYSCKVLTIHEADCSFIHILFIFYVLYILHKYINTMCYISIYAHPHMCVCVHIYKSL